MSVRVGMSAIARIAGIAAMVAVTSAAGVSGADVMAVETNRSLQEHLTITVPLTAELGGGGRPGEPISHPLGTVHVSDTRGHGGWVAQVSATDFTTGTGTPGQTITRSHLYYWSGPATATTGTGTFTPGQVNAAAAQSLNVPRTAFQHTATGTGSNNTASWIPTIVVYVPSTAVDGDYTGTIDHSVA